MSNLIFKNLLVIIMACAIIITTSIVLAWTEPGSPPPSVNPPPITKSATAQTKSGNLTVNGVFDASQLCIAGNCKTSWPTSNCQRVYYSQDESGSGPTTQYCSWQLKGVVDGAGNAQSISPPPATGYMVCCNYLE